MEQDSYGLCHTSLSHVLIPLTPSLQEKRGKSAQSQEACLKTALKGTSEVKEELQGVKLSTIRLGVEPCTTVGIMVPTLYPQRPWASQRRALCLLRAIGDEG